MFHVKRLPPNLKSQPEGREGVRLSVPQDAAIDATYLEQGADFAKRPPDKWFK